MIKINILHKIYKYKESQSRDVVSVDLKLFVEALWRRLI